jgi:hypothetical protein
VELRIISFVGRELVDDTREVGKGGVGPIDELAVPIKQRDFVLDAEAPHLCCAIGGEALLQAAQALI